MDDLKLIKRHYGEEMSHFCRKAFPTLLEEKGKLYTILDENFVHSKVLYKDIINDNKINDFEKFIYSKMSVKRNKAKTDKTPYELLDKAGYLLFECNTDEEIQRFRKYYETKELLCTFNDNRLKTHHVFFALKKDVKDIERSIAPRRQDEYGTSVISIQFSKGNKNYLSIKNRYNHTVNNPDATFSNNLDNIIPGLTYAFEKYYNLNITNYNTDEFELSNYAEAPDKKLHKYNYEINNDYYTTNNVLFNYAFEASWNKETHILADYYLISLKDKKIELFNTDLIDAFPDMHRNIDKIEVLNNGEYKDIIVDNEIIITINKENQIIGYINPIARHIDDCFMLYNNTLEYIEIPNVTNIGTSFLFYDDKLKYINAPKIKKVDQYFTHSDAFNSISGKKLVRQITGEYRIKY